MSGSTRAGSIVSISSKGLYSKNLAFMTKRGGILSNVPRQSKKSLPGETSDLSGWGSMDLYHAYKHDNPKYCFVELLRGESNGAKQQR